MIREVSSKDIQYSDKELNKILKKYDDEVMNYVKNTLLYELASFQLASAYNHDCIWPDSSLENEYIEAMGFLSFVKPALWFKLSTTFLTFDIINLSLKYYTKYINVMSR